MKRQNTLQILFAVVLLAVIAGCETFPSSGPDALVGQWTNSLSTVWTINPDGTFHVATTKPRAQIWGTYTVSGDTLTVQETRQSGKVPKNCRGPGMYKFSRPDANTLAFVLVNDACKPASHGFRTLRNRGIASRSISGHRSNFLGSAPL